MFSTRIFWNVPNRRQTDFRLVFAIIPSKCALSHTNTQMECEYEKLVVLCHIEHFEVRLFSLYMLFAIFQPIVIIASALYVAAAFFRRHIMCITLTRAHDVVCINVCVCVYVSCTRTNNSKIENVERWWVCYMFILCLLCFFCVSIWPVCLYFLGLPMCFSLLCL